MENCGCATDASGGNGPLLTGQLDPSFASPATASESVADVGGVGGGSGQKLFSLGWFLEAGLVVLFILGAAYVLDKTRKEHE